MKKFWFLSMIFAGMAATAVPLLATGDENGDGFSTGGIESLTTTAGEAWAAAMEDDENKNLVVELPDDVSEDGTISGGLAVSCLATPNEADGFQGGPRGDVVWKVMKGHETKGGQDGSSSFSYVIQRLGRYRISATSGNTIAQYLIVGPMTSPNDTGNDQVGPVGMSRSSNNGERFILVPPKTTAFPQDKIILKALGSADDQFEALFEWTCDPAARGTANNDKANLYEVKRADFQDPQSLAPVVLKVQLKSSGTELDKVTILSGYVEEVKFSGNGSNYHEIRLDDGSKVYSAPHLKDTDGDGDGVDPGEENKPVAYTRNTKPTIEAKLKIGSASNLQNVKIRAHGSDGVEIPETAATVSGDTVSLPPTECSTNLPDAIKFYDKKGKAFELEWQVKIDSADWITIATTKHTVYVTLNNPATPSSRRQETLFRIGCEGGKEKTDEASAIPAIWQEFTDRDIRRMDSRVLNYYGSYAILNTTTEDLIKFGDGQCMAWCKFLIDVYRTQGMTGQLIKEAIPFNPEHFMIMNWDYKGSGMSHKPVYKFLNICNNEIMSTPVYEFLYAEAIDLNGIPAQSRENPPSIFQMHYVVSIGGIYYDPSYGVRYNGELDFDANISGFCLPNESLYVSEVEVGLDLNNNGNETDLSVAYDPCLISRERSTAQGVKFGADLSY